MLIGYIIVIMAAQIAGRGLNPNHIGMFLIILILMFFFVLGYVFLLSAITVYLRDIQYILGSINMLFFFLTPMYFVARDATGLLGKIIWFNPFTYYIESFHQMLYYGVMPDMHYVMVCAILPIFSISIGLLIFRHLKKGFAERL